MAVSQFPDQRGGQPLPTEEPVGVLGFKGFQPSIRGVPAGRLSGVSHPAQSILPFSDGIFVRDTTCIQYPGEYVRLVHRRQIPAAVVVTECAGRDSGSSGHLTNGQAGVLPKAGQPASEVFAREDPIRIGRVGARLPCSTHRSSPGTLTGYLSVRSTGRTAIANPRTALYGSSVSEGSLPS